jgi:glucose/mannose transport system permease protein
MLFGLFQVFLKIAYANLFLFSSLYVVGATAIGLLLAILIDQRVRAEALWRTIYLYPLAVSFVVTGTVWRWLLSPSTGTESVIRQLGWRASSSTGSCSARWRSTPW